MPDYHGFGETFAPKGKRTVYDTLSYQKRLMISEGELKPAYLEEVIPGSVFSLKDAFVLKNIPSPYRAVFDDAYLDVNYFFVPKRLLWKNFQEFIGADATPDAYTDPAEYVEPVFHPVDGGTITVGAFSVLNCLGIPAGPVADDLNLAPLAAYALVWNEFYRDENLQDENPFPSIWNNLSSGAKYQTNATGFNLAWAYTAGSSSIYARVNKYHDLFTSCLPSPQKGNAVTVPFALDSAPVMGAYGKGIGGNEVPLFHPLDIRPGGTNTYVFSTSTSAPVSGANGSLSLAGGGKLGVGSGSITADEVTIPNVNNGYVTASNLVASLQDAQVDIHSIEIAVAAQGYLRALAVGGSRYTELLRYVYGVSPRDETLQRPEFLGTIHKKINFNQVASTAGDTLDNSTSRPTGALGGYMSASGNDRVFVRQFKEHGYIIGLASIRIKHSYGQGIPKIFLKKDRFDYWNRFFDRIGLVAVSKKEIYAGASGTFGFNEAWYENRNHADEVGAFGAYSTDIMPNDLRAFTYADTYASAPTLSDAWISEGRGNIDQTLVGQDDVPQFVLGFDHQVKATLPISASCMPRGL